ncbi:hypothetical protein [Actinoplanes sp. L3-i22]|uniref:hypothetical protein n=1 Tax=Actinoplanes sp. L3-i22 TaxID=2836373 RepID=UPI001C74AE3D|nr:hypothetical protein [Actinoplanes sp. L3-i22]BCY12344.1 hypothetical protein L3i22_074320 [Actinoplanes sp. L3-i22]
MNNHDDHDPLAGLEDWARKTERKVRRSRRLGGLASKLRYVVMAVVLAGLIAAMAPLLRSMWRDKQGDPAPVAVDGITATTSASARPTDPFEGTAAARYPIGVQGITLPEAKAVTGFDAGEVRSALDRVRAAMAAARLDTEMTVAHHPEKFLGMLAPTNRTGIAKWFKSDEFGSVATWIDPAVKLDPDNRPRVSGRVTYKSVIESGDIRTLRVTTNFVWVYAFRGDFAYRPLAVAHDEIVWDFPKTKNLRAADQGMWVHTANGYHAWIDCVAADKGLLAPTPRGGGGRQDGIDRESLAKPDHSLDIPDDCP